MKIWTEPEMQALRNRYPVESTAVLAVDLGVDPVQLRYKAFSMGVKKQIPVVDSHKYRNRKARNWKASEDEMIKTWWPVIRHREQPGKNSQWLANQLGVSVVQVRTRAAALGLRVLRQKEPPWTDDELELLDQCLHLAPRAISHRFKRKGYHRSEAAIVVQRYRKLGGLANATNGYSAHQLAEFLGISSIPVIGWIKKGWLKATPRGETVADHGGPGDRWNISPKAIREFLFENAALINPRGINFVWLMDLLRDAK